MHSGMFDTRSERMPGYRKAIAFCLLFLALPAVVWGQEDEASEVRDTVPSLLIYGSKGFELRSTDGNYLMQIQWRGQFRVSYPTDEDPINLEDFQDIRWHLNVNRARMKVGGHAFMPSFKYYLEYELFASNLLDFRLMYELRPWLKLKVGQWKVQYNRERIISSGKQQTVERSILTRVFTVDRQQGISLYGRLGKDKLLDVNYWVSVFMGTGRGASENDDNKLMWMTRWQWNLIGESVPFSGSDLTRHERLSMLLAVAGVTNTSPYTRFSQAGGGQLDGFEEGMPGQYKVDQLLLETAGMYRGFSWQQELHWKQINDRVNTQVTTFVGNLVQAGYFFNQVLDFVPKNLEFYARYAFVYTDQDASDGTRHEISTGLNYFINGHLNKVTLEFSHLDDQIGAENVQEGNRYRLQWDVSF